MADSARSQVVLLRAGRVRDDTCVAADCALNTALVGLEDSGCELNNATGRGRKPSSRPSPPVDGCCLQTAHSTDLAIFVHDWILAAAHPLLRFRHLAGEVVYRWQFSLRATPNITYQGTSGRLWSQEMADRLAPEQRHQVFHNGQLVYEWDQTLQEVNLYVAVPPGVKAKQMYVNIELQHVKFGINPNPPYLDADLEGTVKLSECFWTLEDGVLHITLQKLRPGEPWPSAIKGHVLDHAQQQKDQQRLLLERFQREHPGFDFSGATVNGQVPNPRTFMGGMQ